MSEHYGSVFLGVLVESDAAGSAREQLRQFRLALGPRRSAPLQHCVLRLVATVERIEHRDAIGAGDNRLAVDGE
jgi:hypothetical protein